MRDIKIKISSVNLLLNYLFHQLFKRILSKLFGKFCDMHLHLTVSFWKQELNITPKIAEFEKILQMDSILEGRKSSKYQWRRWEKGNSVKYNSITWENFEGLPIWTLPKSSLPMPCPYTMRIFMPLSVSFIAKRSWN